MSIVANLNTKVVIQGGVAGLNAARRMAEFSYLIQQPLNVEAFVYPPDAGKTYDLPFGSTIVPVPVYRSVKEAAAKHPVNTSLIYVGANPGLLALRFSSLASLSGSERTG